MFFPKPDLSSHPEYQKKKMEIKPNGKHVTEAPGSYLLKKHIRERSSAQDFMWCS